MPTPLTDADKVVRNDTGKRIATALETIATGMTGDGAIITPLSSIPIPASGSSASYNLTSLTSDHELVRWNFSTSAENNPPVNLTWATYNGYFTVANTGGITSESIRPVFALPQAVAITSHT